MKTRKRSVLQTKRGGGCILPFGAGGNEDLESHWKLAADGGDGARQKYLFKYSILRISREFLVRF